ncbi:hypothetical protein, partial [Cronobacter malonaticus]|uniref:hypothetical protein n=1 Tax=Cronobacter malonaticus TaxID=413503 RepID=UPI000519B05B
RRAEERTATLPDAFYSRSLLNVIMNDPLFSATFSLNRALNTLTERMDFIANEKMFRIFTLQ